MTATSKNIELIVKQWTSFDLKTIQVKYSFLYLSFRVELIKQFSKQKKIKLYCVIYIWPFG
jgi:hypothetical protein